MSASEIKLRFDLLGSFLNERLKRLYLGAEALSLGRGGIARVSEATGVSPNTVLSGCKELKSPEVLDVSRVRKPGGGRKKSLDLDPTFLKDLEGLIEPVSRGDPESVLRWTCKSTRRLARELNGMGHKVSHMRVADGLHVLGYSLQANQKTLEGSSHPDRNAQFEHISQVSLDFMQRNQPVISVDSKKKELVGNFRNGGRELRPKGNPEKVLMHDFMTEQGKVNPYGVYDLSNNSGWVNVGVDKDTSAFAVESIRRWWYLMGAHAYPDAKELFITADSGGSNGYRVKLWKTELQKLADETGLHIYVSHFPPGTSKWNKIEHRLFSFISQNWQGKPLLNHEVIINLIAATTTKTGLKVQCKLDKNTYPTGIKIPKEQMEKINLQQDKFHGEWNYNITPRKP